MTINNFVYMAEAHPVAFSPAPRWVRRCVEQLRSQGVINPRHHIADMNIPIRCFIITVLLAIDTAHHQTEAHDIIYLHRQVEVARATILQYSASDFFCS